MLLFHFEGTVLITDSNYRKFKATSIILPADASTGQPQ
jgi:hypothetical protein